MIIATPRTPNAVAEELTGRNYISFSAISTYQQCPLKYFFKYVEGLPEETVSASLVFGGAIHRAVQLHYQELLAGAPSPDLDMLVAGYQDVWREHDMQRITFAKDSDVSSLHSLADRMLRAFQASDLANPSGTILCIEEEFRDQLIPGCPDVLARVDLLIDAGPELVVTDFKTSRSRWNQSQADDSAEQLLLYSELVKELAPGKPVTLQFSVLTKAKEPVFESFRVPADPRRIARTKRVAENVWRAIEAGHFFPAPSAMNCPTCPFRDPCRAWTG
jgi:putative RecB family exonuclease